MKLKRLFYLVMMLAALLISGCLGGPTEPKTYILTVKVLDEASLAPIPSAKVIVTTTDGTVQKTTDDAGTANFVKLTGQVEILVEAGGYGDGQAGPLTMNKNQEAMIKLAADQRARVVTDVEQLRDAIDNLEITSVTIDEDLDLTEELVIPRPLDLVVNKTVQGTLLYEFEDEAEIEFSGQGKIEGNLIVEAPQATVSNHLQVDGEVWIGAVAVGTWNEYAADNRLHLATPEVALNVYGGARSIIVEHTAGQNLINILEGPIGDFKAYTGVEVSGADKIAVAWVESGGVSFDYAPRSIQGEYQPQIRSPFVPGSGGALPAFTPSQPHPDEFAGFFAERFHYYDGYELELTFPAAATLGADGYTLEYWDVDSEEWEMCIRLESPSQNNATISPTSTQERFRLKALWASELDYYSNEIKVPVKRIGTFYESTPALDQPLVERESRPIGQFAAKDRSGNPLNARYFWRKWFRLDPVTYEMAEIPGANTDSYTPTIDDLGHHLVLRIYGDGTNAGGFVQIKTPPVGIANKGFISGVTAEGFVLNLEKSVSDLAPEQLYLLCDTPGFGHIVPVSEVTALDGNARFLIEAQMPEGTEHINLESRADHWVLIEPDDEWIRIGIHYSL